MSVWGAIAGGAANILGTAANAGLAYSSAKKLQEDQQQFQTSFYKQRYQRTMEDMRAAGLNPILAYKTGVGSAAGGGIASAGFSASNLGDTMTRAYKAPAEKEQAEAGGAAARETVNTQKALQAMYNQQRATSAASMEQIGAQTHLTRTAIPAAQTQMEFDQTPVGEFLIKLRRAVGLGSDAVSEAAGAASSAKGVLSSDKPERLTPVNPDKKYGPQWRPSKK